MLTSLSGNEVGKLVRLGRAMIEAPDATALRHVAAPLMLDLFAADQFASFVYDDDGASDEAPVVLNMDPANIARYRAYYQFHDPVTARMRRCGRAVHVHEVMARDRLEKTEFFNDFLGFDHLHYGMNFHAFARTGGGMRHLGDLRIWRRREHGNFDRRDVALLQAVGELFETALAAKPPAAALPAPSPVDRFAMLHGLTAREKDVLACLAAGRRDAEIARQLGISPETVRTHLKAIYQKTALDGRVSVVSALLSLE